MTTASAPELPNGTYQIYTPAPRSDFRAGIEAAAKVCESGVGDTLDNDACCQANAAAIRALLPTVEGERKPLSDCVICPKCTHQFPAIPVDVQTELSELRARPAESMAVARFVEDEDCGHVRLLAHTGPPMKDGDLLYTRPSPAAAVSVPEGWRLPPMPMEIMEWCWHMDLHLTEHDIQHAGKALRAAWPHVSKWLRKSVGPGKSVGKPFATPTAAQGDKP
jgi:hypothetical protein